MTTLDDLEKLAEEAISALRTPLEQKENVCPKCFSITGCPECAPVPMSEVKEMIERLRSLARYNTRSISLANDATDLIERLAGIKES